ncbi:MAG: TolC family protein [Myxococcales bacterium]|nr:TolC family protein [Myxococcales bacterium]
MRRLTGLVLTCACLASQPALADDKPPPRVNPQAKARVSVYTLRRCLELAELNYPKVGEARARLRQKEAQLSQAYTAPFSEWTLTGGVGPAPTVRGTSVYSPNTDVALTSNMALAWQMGIDGVVPLWTFGKITNLWDAADAQIKVGVHEVKKEKNDVKLSVRRAFYGVQLARDSLSLVRDAARQIDKHMGRLEARVATGDGDDIELLKVKMYRAELEARESEAEKQERIALAGLRFLTGVKGGLDIPDRPLVRVPHTLAPLGRYLDAARLFRPEVNMARAGVLARQAQVRLEQSRYFPDLGLALSARYARAPEVTNQTNPYVSDSANRFLYGAALALKWKLDFLPQSARVAQARAQLEEIRATERYALGGVGTEVEQAFAEAADAGKRVDAYTRAQGYARQWLIKVQQGIDVGTFDDEDIVAPAKEYALKRFSQLSAVYEYNIAIAKLSQATGWDSIAPVE